MTLSISCSTCSMTLISSACLDKVGLHCQVVLLTCCMMMWTYKITCFSAFQHLVQERNAALISTAAKRHHCLEADAFLLVASCLLQGVIQTCVFAAKFLQPLLAFALSKFRAPKSSAGYKAIGGGLPLRRITDEQAVALQEALRRKGQNADVYVAMRYWYPFTEEALEKIKEDNVTRSVVLSLYPQVSISTSGSSLRLLEEVRQAQILMLVLFCF